MKKVLFYFMLLNIFACFDVNAQNGNGDNNGKKKIVLTPIIGNTNNPTGQGDLFSISAEFDSHELILSVTNYFGYSDILIFKSPNHHVMYDENEYVSDSSPLSIDISSFQP
jgi:hypothetical protein